MKTNYTPTPWHITTNPHDAGDGSFYIVDQNINPSVCLRLDTQDSEQDRANAEFIVRAVNNHQALVQELKNCLAELEANSGYDRQDEIRAVLANI